MLGMMVGNRGSAKSDLLLNFKVLKIKNAYDDGYSAYLNDLRKSDNPFNNNDDWDLLRAWDEGYDAAAWDD